MAQEELVKSSLVLEDLSSNGKDGGAFTQVLKSHGKDGRYLELVGPFANLSDDFMVLYYFLGRARAL